MPNVFKPRTSRLSTWFLTKRSLTTRPRTAPSFVNSWDPITHKPVPPKRVAQGEGLARQVQRLDALGKTYSKQLNIVQAIRIPYRKYLSSPDRRIDRLNRLLLLVPTSDVNDNLRGQIWRAYTLAKSQHSDLIFWIPDQVWNALWAIQAHRSRRNRHRSSILDQLRRDMQIVGRTTNAGPRAKYYKYMFSYISASRALKEWEAEHSSEPQDGFKAQHLEVGAKMHAYAGHPDRAQEIMNELNRLYPEWSVGVAMAVFRSYTRSESDQHVAEAWKMYKMMREHLGTSATMEHYDSWFSGFLEARHLPFAKIVFKDTIAFSNTIVDKHTGSDLSRKKLEKLLRRLHLLYRLGDDIEKMTGIILLAISILPKDYHSHLFRDWMKSAVVHQAPEVAAQILEMMGKRGLEPAPFHFNLLLRTLLRTGEKRNILRAENLGWRMVDTAIKEPPRTTSNRDAIDALANSERNGTAHQRTEQLQSHIPPANVSTYALIMRHHYNNFQWEHVDYLARKLKESKIRPNSALMTILMDIKCRQGRYDEVWAIYQSSTNVRDGMAGGVFPDGAAIRCLWKTLRLALGDDESREKGVLPTPRELLAETVAWWNLVRNRHDAERFKIGFAGADGGAISGLVMHCFSYTQDLPGSLVALHVLRKRFGIFPSDQAASILQKQTAWVDLRRESAAVKQSFGRGDSHARALDRMGRIYDVLKKQRFKKHNITPDVYAQLSKTEIGDLGLNLVSEFIRVVLKRQHPPEQIESMIDEAKSQIKLPYLKTGDMDISQVV